MDATEQIAGTDASYPGHEHDAAWRRLVAPRDHVNPVPKPRYHLVVIGAGPAGLVTAIAAAGLGANVALVEKHAMGGDCLNVGCVPSKSLLEFAARAGGDFDAALAWLRQVRAEIAEKDSVERYRRAGVDVFLGHARFLDARTVQVGSLDLVARRIVVATGARPVLPPIPGLTESKPLTNETVFDLRQKPGRLLILGAGPVGCELAQAFARLGVEVHVFEVAERILGNESGDAAELVAAALRGCGVTLHLGVRVMRVAHRGSQHFVTTPAGEIAGDQLLVAAGRRAVTDELNLPAANVAVDDGGLISVDDRLRTTNPRVFAAGDVCSPWPFTHMADAHARVVVQNALFAPTATTRKLVVPRCVYTDPELAQVGPTRADLERAGTAFDVYRVAYEETDRGRAQNDRVGFVELVTARNRDTILGATIVGRDAGEQIALVCLAMANGLGIGSFARAVLPYPTRAEALRRLADQFNLRRLTPRIRRLLEGWFRWSS